MIGSPWLRPGCEHVLVVGDVIDDIVVRPLAPVCHDSDTPAHIDSCAGGSGANTAAWLGFLGVPVRFVGRVATRDVDRHRHELERFGVDARLTGDPLQPTGRIVLVVDPDSDARRTMYTDRGANDAVTTLPPELLDGVGVLHVSGYSLFADAPAAAVAPLLAAARNRRIPVTADPGSVAGLRALGAAAFLARLGPVDLLLPNVDEAGVLAAGVLSATGASPPAGTRLAAERAAELLLAVAPLVAVKCGRAGAIVAQRGVPLARIGAGNCDPVDSTGAGDAFAAGFLAALGCGAPPQAAATAAVALATAAVASLGGRPNQPSVRNDR